MVAEACLRVFWFVPVYFGTIQYNFNYITHHSELTRPQLSLYRQTKRQQGKMSAFSKSAWISLTLNSTFNYSQNFSMDKSDNNFTLHGVWTEPVGKIGNIHIKFLKHYKGQQKEKLSK